MKVVIIGGGLAGLSTAITIKEKNKVIDVIVHEKHKKIGYNNDGRRCGEAHHIEKLWEKWKPEANSIFNRVEKLEIMVGEKKYHMYKASSTSDAFILNRQEFISQLGKRAAMLGVKIQTNNKIKSINDLDAEVIVDSSGCPSFVKRELNINKGQIGVGYQQTIENSNCFDPENIKIFFTGDIGYYWIFPRNPKINEVNIGVGVLIDIKKYNLKDLLNTFKQKMKITGEINYSTGGMIPVGLQRPLKYNNIIFVGDSGVGTFPFTGEGIYRALYSGEIAGKCIAKGKIKDYPIIMNREFIKWDIIGKSFIKINNFVQKIGPNAMLKSMNFFLKNFYFPAIYHN